MPVEKPIFVVAMLPSQIADWVHAVRLQFEPGIAHMPAEITLAGSSGIGPIMPSPETSIAQVIATLKETLEPHLPFSARLIKIDGFPNTDIIFAAPERKPFDALHALIARSPIEFANSPFPFTPHCSLKGFTMTSELQRQQLEALELPRSSFEVNEIALFTIDNMQPQQLASI